MDLPAKRRSVWRSWSATPWTGEQRPLLPLADARRIRASPGFYDHLIPEFERSSTDPLHLLLLLKGIRRTLGSRPR